LGKLGMIISLRLNIRLIPMDRRRLKGRRLRIGVMDWTGLEFGSTVSTSLRACRSFGYLMRSTLLESRHVSFDKS
jgi:hypothetical protein